MHDSPHPPNHLIDEKSPYLQQHAHNPVDWYPWSEEAFDKAVREDKPVFLSIGYSTCHWCHVMERESFEDQEVAKVLNQGFVSIKVDREERPDIDGVYMTVCQMMTGSGGWPLNLMLTPQKKPFFAGTYFPKQSRPPQIGLLELLARVGELWKDKRSELLASAERITGILKRSQADTSGQRPGADILDAAFTSLKQRFDPDHGGFRPAPKFPSPHTLLFLLRYWKQSGNEQALAMAVQTLKAMRCGGLFDHLGFGFHRYSTDEAWLLPHFEKMLYDQAMLAMAYAEACQATGDPLFGRTLEEIFTYVRRDLASPHGGFYSAEDADSEGQEGKFYVWTEAEIEEVLTPEEATLVKQVFNTHPKGNFREEHSRELTGANILHLGKDSLPGIESDRADPTVERLLESARTKLFLAREKRVRPGMDKKILTDWNGLMIAALALGGKALGNPEHIETAKATARFITDEMYEAQTGRLMHRFKDGEAAIPGFLDDSAFLCWGMIELYQATHDTAWLKQALSLAHDCLDRFRDSASGGFYLQAADAETVLLRQKESHDGALPSGNAVMLNNLQRLGHMTGQTELLEAADQLLTAFSGALKEHPPGYLHMLSGLDLALGPMWEVVVVGTEQNAETQSMLGVLRKEFLPRTVHLFKDPDNPEAVERLCPAAREREALEGKTTAHVCMDRACRPPVTDAATLKKVLHEE